MQLYPAIDLRGGKCVRLKQGDYRQETVFSNDPLSTALDWQQQGGDFLHLVDLDGARTGQPENLDSVRRILQTVDIPCQMGGGVRTTENVARLLDIGLKRVIVGTQALENPTWVEQMAEAFPGQIVLGIDAREGMVAGHGWEKTSHISTEQLLNKLNHLPFAGVIYTDISRDGMLTGPNLEAIRNVLDYTPLDVIASGGVKNLEDVKNLANLPLAGCIIGRALYEGSLQLSEAKRTIAKSALSHQVSNNDGTTQN